MGNISIDISAIIVAIVGFVITSLLIVVVYFLKGFVEKSIKFQDETREVRIQTTEKLNQIITDNKLAKLNFNNHEKSDEDFHILVNDNLSVIKQRLEIIG